MRLSNKVAALRPLRPVAWSKEYGQFSANYCHQDQVASCRYEKLQLTKRISCSVRVSLQPCFPTLHQTRRTRRRTIPGLGALAMFVLRS